MKQEGSPKPLLQLWSLLHDTETGVDFHNTEEVSEATFPLPTVLLDTRFTIDLEVSRGGMKQSRCPEPCSSWASSRHQLRLNLDRAEKVLDVMISVVVF